MVEIVALLFHHVKPAFAEGMALEYRAQYEEIFADYPLEKYTREIDMQLRGCEASYPDELSDAELEAYRTISDEKARTAFRICRSLSKCEKDESTPPPCFFLSCQQLGTRLGDFDMAAGRILKDFEKRGFIKTIKLGTRHKQGAQGIATRFLWRLFPADDCPSAAGVGLLDGAMETQYPLTA